MPSLSEYSDSTAVQVMGHVRSNPHCAHRETAEEFLWKGCQTAPEKCIDIVAEFPNTTKKRDIATLLWKSCQRGVSTDCALLVGYFPGDKRTPQVKAMIVAAAEKKKRDRATLLWKSCQSGVYTDCDLLAEYSPDDERIPRARAMIMAAVEKQRKEKEETRRREAAAELQKWIVDANSYRMAVVFPEGANPMHARLYDEKYRDLITIVTDSRSLMVHVPNESRQLTFCWGESSVKCTQLTPRPGPFPAPLLSTLSVTFPDSREVTPVSCRLDHKDLRFLRYDRDAKQLAPVVVLPGKYTLTCGFLFSGFAAHRAGRVGIRRLEGGDPEVDFVAPKTGGQIMIDFAFNGTSFTTRLRMQE
ncbi:MAG: hypothetical protein WD696_03585 [Bryobacteraceae bacterium]